MKGVIKEMQEIVALQSKKAARIETEIQELRKSLDEIDEILSIALVEWVKQFD